MIAPPFLEARTMWFVHAFPRRGRDLPVPYWYAFCREEHDGVWAILPEAGGKEDAMRRVDGSGVAAWPPDSAGGGVAVLRRILRQRRMMIKLLRQLLAIAILPFTVTVLVPIWIARHYGVTLTIGRSAGSLLVQFVGLAVLGLGFILFVVSVWQFASEGKGTLAPWDPPRVFVVRGPYQFVRNPMISGVMLLLFGEALALLSLPHATWAICFVILNLIYIPLIEEPRLEGRFGDSYREYRRHVRRFIPRFRPWRPAT
jgi:protein-S-isoprenylcysteine O-methyltransferase Ste14